MSGSYGKLKKEPSYIQRQPSSSSASQAVSQTPSYSNCLPKYNTVSGATIYQPANESYFVTQAAKNPSSSSVISPPSDRYVSLNCQPLVVEQRQAPRYYVTEPKSVISPSSSLHSVNSSTRPAPTVVTAVSGPVAQEEKNKLIAYLDSLERPRYCEPPVQNIIHPAPVPQPIRKPVEVIRPAEVVYPPVSQPPVYQHPRPNDDLYRNGKLTVMDAPSPPVYPQYKPPVLPPAVSASYVNPATGVVTTYEAMVIDAPDSRILEPPPLSFDNSLPVSSASPEYRINKVCLILTIFFSISQTNQVKK